MKITEKIAAEYPNWARKKRAQPRPEKHIREANGYRPNAAPVAMRPEYITLEHPQA